MNTNIFKFQDICDALSDEKINDLREYALYMGIPPQLIGSDKSIICRLLAPRVSDYMIDPSCDNVDEPTLNGDDMNTVPNYLKYTWTDSNGKRYCYHIGDLYQWIMTQQQTGVQPMRDPYRRFIITRSILDDIETRYHYLENVLKDMIESESSESDMDQSEDEQDSVPYGEFRPPRPPQWNYNLSNSSVPYGEFRPPRS